MIVTEEEAKTKWCPQTRLTATDQEWHTNRPRVADVADGGFDRCAGSGCMAWRWAEPRVKRVHEPEFDTYRERMVTDSGYCGLSGKP